MSLAANDDDSEADEATGLIQTDVTTGRREHGYRFTGAAELAGKIIISAVLRVTSSFNGSVVGDSVMRLFAEAADSASQFVDGSAYSNFTGRPVTTAFQDWTILDGTTFAVDQVFDSPDFAPVIQEVTDRPGFAGVLHVLRKRITDNAFRHWHREGSVAKAAVLVVCYDEPILPITIEGNCFTKDAPGINVDSNRLVIFEMANAGTVVFALDESEIN